MKQKLSLRVAVFGPSDVAEHVQAAEAVIKDLSRSFSRRDVLLEVVHWSTDAVPGAHAEGPQVKIDEDLLMSDLDVVIVIFWQRHGSPVKDTQSGTEHELNLALRRWRETRWPHIMVYFDEKAVGRPDGEQLARVQALQQRLFTEHEVLCWRVQGPQDFERQLRPHLERNIEAAVLSYQAASKDHGRELRCIVNAYPRTVRQSGFSERLGDIALHFEVESGVMIKEPISVDLTCTISIPITNRLLNDQGLTDCIIRDERTGQEIARGVRINNQSVVFQNVRVLPAPNLQPSRLRIVNLRGAAGWSVSSFTAKVDARPQGQPYSLPANGTSAEVATVGVGLSWFLKRNGLVMREPRKQLETAVFPLSDALVVSNYQEGFGGAFTTANQEKDGVGVGYGGTLLHLVLNGVPDGLALWASIWDIPSEPGATPRAQLVPLAGQPAIEPWSDESSCQARLLTIRNGMCGVTWEWVDETRPLSIHDRRLVRFALFAAGSSSLHSMTLQGSLGPINTQATAGGEMVPIPRFAQTGSAQGVPMLTPATVARKKKH